MKYRVEWEGGYYVIYRGNAPLYRFKNPTPAHAIAMNPDLYNKEEIDRLLKKDEGYPDA